MPDDGPLSQESEERILAMVQRQLDRPNPPDTKVLYRRAMHFVDRDVRELSVTQFNAKFPLRVKRHRARRRAEAAGETRRSRAENGGSSDSGTGSRQKDGDEPDEGPDVGEGRQDEDRRRRLREVFLEYARLVGTADGSAALIDAYRRVGSFVDRALASPS